MSKLGWRLIPIALFVILSIFLWRGLSLDPHHLPSAQLGKPLPVFRLKQLHNPRDVFSSEVLSGQVTLLNVWASWCQACVEEQDFMMELADQGVPIYGLNYKDKTQDARHWLTQWGDPYRVIGQDKAGQVAIDLGVYGAPETFIIDKKGMIRYRHVGVMDKVTWLRDIAPLMKQLEQAS